MTSVAFSKNNEYVFCGGIENKITAINLHQNKVDFVLCGHTDTITGLSLSNNGKYLLSNSMDNTLKIWDVRPYVENQSRLVKSLSGHFQNSGFEKQNLIRCAWSHDDRFVAAGSSDKMAYVWDFHSGNIEHRLGGHKGVVNDVKFGPKMKNDKYAFVSASSDKTMFLGYIDS